MSIIITVLGKQDINGISSNTGNWCRGTLVDYSYVDDTAEKGLLFGRVYVSKQCCISERIHIFSDYELEIEPGQTYASKFVLVEKDGYFKRLGWGESV